ncbi:MAG: Kdo hydroxylase family protein [Gammaproteobacteria bacterium]|nr:Kdo hydroxylase family protein [Gammaproteobacteria bacterium]
MNILNEFDLRLGDEQVSPAWQRQATTCLEQEGIVFFPNLAFVLKENEQDLLSAACNDGKAKNVSYNCHDHTLRGMCVDDAMKHKLLTMMHRFNEYACDLVHTMLPEYVSALQVGRTSYRPVEVYGRKSKSYKKDDSRLHVDAFPANPVQGRRILRVFSNIHPQGHPRVWRAGESFEAVAKRFLPRVKRPLFPGKFLKCLGITKSIRTPYDHMMLQIHDRMKADKVYQKEIKKREIAFPAGSTWIVQTDCVSHAVLSGQFLLEQTFYLPVTAMLNEQLSPLRILETLSGRRLI